MEQKRIYLNNQQEKVSFILNPVRLDVDLNKEAFGIDEDNYKEEETNDDIDLLGDFEL